MADAQAKDAVRAYWNREPCGTRGLPTENRREFFRQLEAERYALEPYIKTLVDFKQGKGKRLLEVGVGAGTDFVNWVRAGADATGVDLTEAGVGLTRERLQLEGLKAEVRVADAESLPFEDETFDIVYSWGVLMCSPDTARAVKEVHRVLKPGGRAIVLLYHHPSWVGFALWGVHCLGKMRPWRSPRWAVEKYLESPGTKAYTMREARELFGSFASVHCRTQLSHGDLLLMRPGQRYVGGFHRLLWRLYPRWLVRMTGDRFGTGLFIEAAK